MVFLLCAYADAVTLWIHKKFRKINLHVLSLKFRVSGMYIASIVALLLDPGQQQTQHTRYATRTCYNVLTDVNTVSITDE